MAKRVGVVLYAYILRRERFMSRLGVSNGTGRDFF